MSKNIEMNYYNGNSYEKLVPQTVAGDNSCYLTTTTAGMFGLGANAVPDNVFAFVGKYNQYWWARTAQEIATKYRYKEVKESGQITFYYSKIMCSDAVTLNEDTGELALVNPIVPTSYSEFKSHPYCKSTGQGVYINAAGTTSYNETDVFYCPNNPSHSATSLVRFDSNVPVYKLVVESYQINVGNVEFVHSSDRNAYPDSGISGNYEYAYLGIPFDNAVTAPKIETGSYVGTGTYGVSNPNSLTFGINPTLVCVYQKPTSSYLSSTEMMIFVPDRVFRLCEYHNLQLGYLVQSQGVVGNTIEWYSTQAANCQGNALGSEYNYIAIG